MTDFDLDPDSLKYDHRGLVVCVAQDVASGAVLMLAWADREAVAKTLETGEAHFWSRSRRELWRKGGTSGNVLTVREIRADCDRDALLLRVDPAGPACHRGTRSCFEPNAATLELGWLAEILDARKDAAPESSYTARLLAAGPAKIAQKVGEEAVETVIAALTGTGGVAGGTGDGGDATGAENADALVDEAADLLYHLLVLLQVKDVPPLELARALRRRHAARAETNTKAAR